MKKSTGKAKSVSVTKEKSTKSPEKPAVIQDKAPSTKRKTPAVEARQTPVTICARGNKDRRDNDRRKVDAPVAVERRLGERRAKVNRRRQIDPTTCERDYTGDEVEFMSALDEYKRKNGRMFPTCSEILEVIRGLGYAKPEHKPVAVMPEFPAAIVPESSSSPVMVEQAV